MTTGRGSQQPPTMADVARLAHVSTMTASRALRNAPDCHPDTRARVLKAAAELGYRVNPIVTLFQSMVRRREGAYRATIGWLNDFPRRAYHRGLLYEAPYWNGARERAAGLGFVLEEIWIGEDGCDDVAALAARVSRIAASRGIPGLVIPFLLHPTLAMLPFEEFAVAAIGPLYPEQSKRFQPLESFPERYHHAQADYYANINLALNRLRERGYRRPGLMMPDWQNRVTGRQYEAAYLIHQQQLDPADRVPVWRGQIHVEDAPSLRKWLLKWKPDCVLCTYNHARPQLEAAGWIVPQDISLVHLSIADDVRNWSGVDPGHARLGAAAVDLVIQQMQRGECGPPAKPVRLSILGDWVDGQTTRNMP